MQLPHSGSKWLKTAINCLKSFHEFSNPSFSIVTWFPVPVIVYTSLSKLVKLLHAQVWSIIFTNFSNLNFWRDFDLRPNCGRAIPVSSHCICFFFKTCQTVACISMIRHFHEFFKIWIFGGILTLGPICGRASDPARTEIFNYVRHVCCCNKVLFFRREQRRSCCPWQHQHQ